MNGDRWSVSPVNINERRFRQALLEELPGLIVSVDEIRDMLDLRFQFRVTHHYDNFVNEDAALAQVQVLAERLRQEALTKTGASRIVQAATEQAEQYRLENVRMGRMIQDRDEQIKDLKARITDLQDQISETLADGDEQ